MKRITVLATMMFPVAVLAAGPVVSNVSYTQKDSRLLKITYSLANQPAVITVDVQTNVTGDTWASIGPENFPSLSGDVGVVVPAGERTIFWNARADWPDRIVEAPNFRIEVTAWATNAPPDYMTVDLYQDRGVRYYANAESVPGGVGDVRYKTTHLLMRKIPAAGVEWTMGSPSDESGRMTTEKGEGDERQHKVILSDDYYMAVFATTQKQFCRYNIWHRSHPHNMRATDGCAYGPQYDTYPLNRMFLTDFRGATKGLGWPANHDVDDGSWIGQLRSTTGLDFDLPTEAQWEFACRGGTTTAYCNGTDLRGSPNDHVWSLDGIGSYAQYNYSSGGRLHAVGEMRPNGYGLYDMIGNAFEMCLDWYGDYPSGDDTQIDPRGAAKPDPYDGNASVLVMRGGWFKSTADALRSACRSTCKPQNWSDSVGFRIVCPAVARYPKE